MKKLNKYLTLPRVFHIQWERDSLGQGNVTKIFAKFAKKL